MWYDIVYTFAIIIAAVIGVWAFFSLFNASVSMRKLMKKIKHNDGKAVDIFTAAGWKITLRQYNMIRYALYILFFGYIVYQYSLTYQMPYILLVILIALLIATNPGFTKLSIVPVLLRTTGAARAKRLNEEVLQSFIQLKNLAVLDTQLNAYELMKRVIRHTKQLKQPLSEIMKCWNNMEQRKDALDAFAKYVGTADAENFVKIIEKLELTKPIKLEEELTFYEQQMYETRQTAKERQNGSLGDLFFSVVTLLLMAVLLNFIFVVIFPNISFSF